MSFPASDSIAADHPDLAVAVRALDDHLAQLGPEPFLADRLADHVDLDPGLLFRLLHLYEMRGVVATVDAWLCPREEAPLEPDDEGVLWCDLCAEAHDATDCEPVTAYRLLTVVAAVESQPGPPGAIRDLLLAAFGRDEFERLFRYSPNPALRAVQHRFSTHDGLAEMVDKAIEQCEKQGLLRALLREVAQANPSQYAAHQERIHGLE